MERIVKLILFQPLQNNADKSLKMFLKHIREEDWRAQFMERRQRP